VILGLRAISVSVLWDRPESFTRPRRVTLGSNQCSRRDSSVSFVISLARAKGSQTVEIMVTTGCHRCCALVTAAV